MPCGDCTWTIMGKGSHSLQLLFPPCLSSAPGLYRYTMYCQNYSKEALGQGRFQLTFTMLFRTNNRVSSTMVSYLPITRPSICPLAVYGPFIRYHRIGTKKKVSTQLCRKFNSNDGTCSYVWKEFASLPTGAFCMKEATLTHYVPRSARNYC